MDKPFRRILFIKVCSHRDVLLTTPVINSLKKSYPDTKIDVLPYQNTIPILSKNPKINALYGIKNKKAKVSEKITNFFHLTKVLRANRYDLIVSLADQRMVTILVHLSNACMKTSQDYHYRQSAPWRNSLTHLVPLQGGNMVEGNLLVLTPLGPESLVKQTTTGYPPTSWKHVCCELGHAGVGQNYVATQSTVRQIFKCWGNVKLSAVIDALHACGYEAILTSGPDKDDLTCVNEIAQGRQTLPITALAGKVTSPGLGALIDRVRLSTSVDSAPAYIAATVNTPLVSLFSVTDHIFWRSWSNNMIRFWAGDYQEIPTYDQRNRNEMYLSVIPAADITVTIDKLLPSSTTDTSL